MLSVILYGRNDSHGYNLHKRAAISLNAIAHLLSDPDDEIIFVDYNTPDDLPTFPEAIADTLTPEAVARMRILRVRPAVHNERFAARTHLMALEPIARNVAIRRSNPKNRWVLSTNTDMIFVPRHEGDDLTRAIGALEDGFYHLPRFELPEGLWETMDRKDPVGLIAGAKEWGERFYLNEVILSGGDNVYDGPGDFQLFLREDLFAIGGFHEEMIRGWHLDANVARRMRMLRGKVSTALDRLIGYHCDHTRQATAYHKADRVENSAAIYVDNVFEPQVRDQAQSWGLADVEIEELKLGEASGARYMAGLTSAVQGRLEGFLEAEYVPEAYGRLSYQPAHVLPYLLDLVSCIPHDARIAYVGARRDMAGMFAKAWLAMGGARAVRAPDNAPWLGEAGSQVELAPLDQWLDDSDLFIFEVGAEQAVDQMSLSDEERARLWAVDYAFKQAVSADRQKQAQGGAPRRTLIINGVHNFFEPQVFASVSVTLTPFSSRIRHGYFVDPAASRLKAAAEPDRMAVAALGRIQPFTTAEAARLRELTAGMKSGAGDEVWSEAARLGAEIEALASAGAKGLFAGVGRPDSELLQQLERARPSSAVREVGDLLHPFAGKGVATRLARLEDWEDPEWLRLAGWLFANRNLAELNGRDLWVWERVTLAQNLFAVQPMSSRPKVLLIGALPEAFAFALGALDCEVDIVNPHALSEGGLQATDWRNEFLSEAWMTRTPIGLASDRADAIANGFRYDAAIACQNALFMDGRGYAAGILQNAVRLVRLGGHVGFSATAQMIEEDIRPSQASLSPGLVRGDRFVHALDSLVDLKAEGGVDLRMTPRTFDRLAPIEYPPNAPPALVVGRPPHVATTAVFSLSKGEGADAADWGALSAVITGGSYSGAAPAAKAATAPADAVAAVEGGRLFTAAEVAALAPPPGRRAQPHFGPIFDRLRTADGVSRNPTRIRIPAALGEEVAITAEVGELPPGGYEMLVEVNIAAATTADEVMAIALVGAGRLLAEHAEAGGGGLRRIVAAFDVDEAAAMAPGGVQLAIKGLGAADIDVQEVVLR